MRELSGGGRKFLRAAGISVWILSGVPAVLQLLAPLRAESSGGGVRLTPGQFALWLAAALVFAAAFWVTSGAAGRQRQANRYRVLLAVQAVAALSMFHFVCTGLEITLLAVVAVQLGLFLPLPVGLAWVVVQTVLLAALGSRHLTPQLNLMMTFIATPFEALALFTSYFAAGEAAARREVARANAELRATQELLADSSRLAERARISRELHDVLGHDLTALSLNLEAARHLADGRAGGTIERCQGLAKKLLDGVREVVRSTRGDAAVDLARALRTLTEDIPLPAIHLALPARLAVGDPERAHALVRTVQEVVTNAVRHSGAENLWIEVGPDGAGISVRAHDDGRGARRLAPGHGLTGMRERLERLGGRLDIDPGPGRGFGVRGWLPLGESGA